MWRLHVHDISDYWRNCHLQIINYVQWLNYRTRRPCSEGGPRPQWIQDRKSEKMCWLINRRGCKTSSFMVMIIIHTRLCSQFTIVIISVLFQPNGLSYIHTYLKSADVCKTISIGSLSKDTTNSAYVKYFINYSRFMIYECRPSFVSIG